MGQGAVLEEEEHGEEEVISPTTRSATRSLSGRLDTAF